MSHKPQCAVPRILAEHIPGLADRSAIGVIDAHKPAQLVLVHGRLPAQRVRLHTMIRPNPGTCERTIGSATGRRPCRRYVRAAPDISARRSSASSRMRARSSSE